MRTATTTTTARPVQVARLRPSFCLLCCQERNFYLGHSGSPSSIYLFAFPRLCDIELLIWPQSIGTIAHTCCAYIQMRVLNLIATHAIQQVHWKLRVQSKGQPNEGQRRAISHNMHTFTIILVQGGLKKQQSQLVELSAMRRAMSKIDGDAARWDCNQSDSLLATLSAQVQK